MNSSQKPLTIEGVFLILSIQMTKKNLDINMLENCQRLKFDLKDRREKTRILQLK